MITVLAAGFGRGWWRVGGRFYVADVHRLWTWGQPGCLRVAEVRQVVPGDDGRPEILATSALRRFGVADGVARPLADRRGDCWVADGFVYALTPRGIRAVDAIGAGERGWVGGGGTVVVEGVDGLRVGLRGRTPRAITTEGVDGVRLAEDGGAVAWVDADGAARRSLDGGPRTALSGLPVTDRWTYVDGAIRWGRLRAPPRVREGASARSGALLAGPGGRVWDLAAGRPVTAAGTVFAGVTLAVDGGFVTVDGETGEGHHVGTSGVGAHFRIPLEPDDVVVGGEVQEGAVSLATALGAGFRVVGSAVTAAEVDLPRRRRKVVVDTVWGPFPDAETAQVDHRTWIWDADGWLLAFPTPRYPH